MRMTAAVFWLLLLVAPCVFAGHIFGTIRENGQPLRGTEIVVNCGANAYRAKTDNSGSYGLYAKETARCSLQVNYQGQSPRTEIFSYNEPTRYDFDLVREQGRLTLRRR